MATDSFLADIDELSDIVEHLDNAEHMRRHEDVDISKLHLIGNRYKEDIMQKVEKAACDDADDLYQLISDCNSLSVDIDNEISILDNYIRDKYRFKFPELESIVQNPIEYALLVKTIGNQMDLTSVDLQSNCLSLPPPTVMVISVAASTTSGKQLPEAELHNAIHACDRALSLHSDYNKLVHFVQTKMTSIAPNLSAIVGPAVAAKLVCTAGGLSALAKMPACDLQLLGANNKAPAGFSSQHSRLGYLDQTEVFQTTPPSSRKRACRVLAAKSILAARVDSLRGDCGGVTGEKSLRLRQEIQRKLAEKMRPPKQPKPIPVPVPKPKKRRGGRRQQKRKQRYAMTETRKLANRVAFNSTEESSLGDGMLGQAAGKLRISSASHGPSKLAPKASKRFKDSHLGSSGLTSSLAFTPVQGIELSNPQPNANQLGTGAQRTYFSEVGTFSNLKRKRT